MLFILPQKGRSQFCPLLNYSFSHIVRICNVVAHALVRRAFFLLHYLFGWSLFLQILRHLLLLIYQQVYNIHQSVVSQKKRKKKKKKEKKVMNKSSCPNTVLDRIVHDFGSNKFRIKSIVNFHFILVDFFSQSWWISPRKIFPV